MRPLIANSQSFGNADGTIMNFGGASLLADAAAANGSRALQPSKAPGGNASGGAYM